MVCLLIRLFPLTKYLLTSIFCTGTVVNMFFCCGGVEGQVQCTVAFEEQDTLELHMFCLDLGTQHDSQEINATNKALQVPRQLFFSWDSNVGSWVFQPFVLNSLGCWMILAKSHMASSWKR